MKTDYNVLNTLLSIFKVSNKYTRRTKINIVLVSLLRTLNMYLSVE